MLLKAFIIPHLLVYSLAFYYDFWNSSLFLPIYHLWTFLITLREKGCDGFI